MNNELSTYDTEESFWIRQYTAARTSEFRLIAENAALRAEVAKRSEPLGYKLVPIDPTEEMIRAACLVQEVHKKYESYEAWRDSQLGGTAELIRSLLVGDYKAMLNVSPKPTGAF